MALKPKLRSLNEVKMKNNAFFLYARRVVFVFERPEYFSFKKNPYKLFFFQAIYSLNVIFRALKVKILKNNIK